MTTPEYGVTPQGFKAMRLEEVRDLLEDLFIAEFGDVNLQAQSVIGQLIGIFSKVLADDWENLQDVYLSQYPNSASGVSLDNVVQLNGLTRLPALQTSVIGAASGIPGTFIPAGSLARLTGGSEIFYSTENATISPSESLSSVVSVTQLLSQPYNVLINNQLFSYSLPTIGLSGSLVSGNAISVKINGFTIPPVPFNTSSGQTLQDLADEIISELGTVVDSAIVVGDSIELSPVLGEQITVNSITITGSGAPTGSTTFRTPASLDEVAENLAEILDESSLVSSSWTSGSTFSIHAEDSFFPYSLTVSSGLRIDSTSSPVYFLAQSYGPIAVPANTLTEIVTPIAGWQSLTNFEAGITGRDIETDEELRLRRRQSLSRLGAATVEAIRSRLLQEVPGVTSVTIFENQTLTQSPISVSFSTDFITGNDVQVNFEGSNIGTVSFSSSHLQVMNDLAALISSQEEIQSVSVGGLGNRDLNITMEDAEEVEIAFNISGGVSQPTYILSGGRPPKSFETVVEGGSDIDVATKIWQLKPAGIATFGNTQIIVSDSQGNPQGIFFTRADDVYIWVDVVLTLNPQETFPSNGLQLVTQAILNYGNSLGIGANVLLQKVQAAVVSVPGVAGAVVTLARTNNPFDAPIFSASDIAIGSIESSAWDTSRIFVSI